MCYDEYCAFNDGRHDNRHDCCRDWTDWSSGDNARAVQEQIMKIELITCEEGDWQVVRVDGIEVFANHRAEFDDWGKILQKISNDSDFSSLDVEYKVIPDEDMEVGNY